MAGVDKLLSGGLKSFGFDKASGYFSPTQMDFLSFALNPQAYLIDKGVNAAAEALGYGSQYRELQGGAKDEKDYYKEVMRDAIGDVLPGAIGDFVRVNPRSTETDNTPAGTYTAWNPETQSFEEQQSSTPVAVPDQFTADRFAAAYDPNSQYNTNSTNYVGPAYPKDMNSSIYASNLTDLLEMLGPYEVQDTPGAGSSETRSLTPQTPDTQSNYTFDPNTGMVVPTVGSESSAPIGYTYDINTGTVVPAGTTESMAPAGYTFDVGSGTNVPESSAPTGYTFDTDTGTVVPMDYGDKFGDRDIDNGYGGKYEYARGGQIYRGKR